MIGSNWVRSGLVTCVYEPRGDKGLEGFQLNCTYPFKEMQGSKGIYFQIYPDRLDFPNRYYETCNKVSFNKYFKEV